MPPRKSNVSQVSAEGEASTSKENGYGVEDLALPKTMVQRLAKGVLPPNTQIQKDALLAISKSATVFVNYLTSHANEQAQRMSKKTIQPKDVLDAVEEIEFGGFLERLNGELAKYNAVQCDKRNSYRRKVREEQKGKTATGADGESGGGEAPATEGAVTGTNGVPVITSPRRNGDSEPQTKRVRGEGGVEIEDEEEDAPDELEGEEEPESEAEDEDEDEGEEVEETFEDAKERLVEEDRLEQKEVEDEEMEDEALDEGGESD